LFSLIRKVGVKAGFFIVFLIITLDGMIFACYIVAYMSQTVVKKPHFNIDDGSAEKMLALNAGIVREKGVKKSTVSIYELREKVIHAIKHYEDDEGEVIGIEGIIQQATPNEVLRFLGKILPKNVEIDKNEKRLIIHLNGNTGGI